MTPKETKDLGHYIMNDSYATIWLNAYFLFKEIVLLLFRPRRLYNIFKMCTTTPNFSSQENINSFGQIKEMTDKEIKVNISKDFDYTTWNGLCNISFSFGLCTEELKRSWLLPPSPGCPFTLRIAPPPPRDVPYFTLLSTVSILP